MKRSRGTVRANVNKDQVLNWACFVVFCFNGKKKLTLRISGVMVLGPLEEKEAMNGAGFVCSCVFGGKSLACGFLYGTTKRVILIT